MIHTTPSAHQGGERRPFLDNLVLKGVKLLILDLDGTVRSCTVPGQPCPNSVGEQALIPGAADAIRYALDRGVRICGATNQGGIGLGYTTETDHAEMVMELTAMLAEAVDRDIAFPVWHCAHAPDAGCACRKPSGEMLRAAMLSHGASAAETLFVGDRDSDRGAAVDAGCRFLDADSWRTHSRPVLETP